MLPQGTMSTQSGTAGKTDLCQQEATETSACASADGQRLRQLTLLAERGGGDCVVIVVVESSLMSKKEDR